MEGYSLDYFPSYQVVPYQIKRLRKSIVNQINVHQSRSVHSRYLNDGLNTVFPVKIEGPRPSERIRKGNCFVEQSTFKNTSSKARAAGPNLCIFLREVLKIIIYLS